MRKSILFALFAIIFFTSHLFSQRYTVSDQSTAVVIGTSTLHDWESDVEEIKGQATIETNSGQLTAIPEMSVQFKVESIKSGKSRMDRITYDALQSEDHPEIHFEIKEVLSVQGNKVKASGNLSIAGFKKEVIVEGALMENGNKIQISGNHAIDMTDFQIDPPTAMLGTIKVGKDIELKFDITFIKK
jgi:polyisoprenoid-binding protein YceI